MLLINAIAIKNQMFIFSKTNKTNSYNMTTGGNSCRDTYAQKQDCTRRKEKEAPTKVLLHLFFFH